jgi:transcriptional regulator with XRE-family HTH domain
MTGDELKEWMTENGWTIRGLAHVTGYSRGAVDRWRDGRNPVPVIVEIAIFGPPLDEREPPPPGTGGGD